MTKSEFFNSGKGSYVVDKSTGIQFVVTSEIGKPGDPEYQLIVTRTEVVSLYDRSYWKIPYCKEKPRRQKEKAA